MSFRDIDLGLLRTFAVVAETGSVTRAAARLNLTQPAVSQQIRRLEDRLQKPLFEARQRPKALTDEGELLHGYARAILRLHDEAVTRLNRPEVSGRVTLGTPDLYATFFLPAILADFGRAYPTVQINLHCALTVPLLRELEAGRVDLVLATQMPDNAPGRFIRSEPLHFITGEHSDAHRRTPLPLAMLPPGNLYRDHAIQALEAHGRPWRLACESESIAGLLAAVQAGLAVTVLTAPAVGPGLRVCSGFDGMPPLPGVDLVLYGSRRAEPPITHLADYLFERLTPGR